jgi:hypothetical protein
MKGVVEIDRQSGNVLLCSFESENTQKIADCVTSILQDVALYMRQTGV